MKYKVIVNKVLLNKINPSVRGLTIYPFIFLKHQYLKTDQTLINHEKIHLKQQLELLILPFYIIYILNYLYNLIIYKSHFSAYYHIVFEREAYANEMNHNYLQTRPWFAFIKYINKKPV